MGIEPMTTMEKRMGEATEITIRHEDGAYWATIEDFPGVFATGDTLDELRVSLEEGISLHLAEPGQEPPKVILSDLHWDEPPHTRAHAGLQYA